MNRRWRNLPTRGRRRSFAPPWVGLAPPPPAQIHQSGSRPRWVFQVRRGRSLGPVPAAVPPQIPLVPPVFRGRARWALLLQRGKVRQRPWFNPPGPQALPPIFIRRTGYRPKWAPLPPRTRTAPPPAPIFVVPPFAGPWRLVQPSYTEKYVIDGLRIPHVVSLTVYGNSGGLFAAECPVSATLEGKQYVFYGGHEYTTFDTALRDLWIASGWVVENVS